jgi:hypothetical protein
VFIADLWQLVFECSTLYALEITFKPTYIDRLKSLEKLTFQHQSKDDEINDQGGNDHRRDPE